MKTMETKKVLTLFIAMALCFGLAACGENENSSLSSETSSNQSAQLDETIALANLTFTATEIIRSEGTSFVKPNDGMVIVAVKLTMENTSSKEQIIAGLTLFDSYADNTKCLISTAGATLYAPMLNGSLAEGKKMEGYHVVEVPIDAKTLMLRFSDATQTLQGNTVKEFSFDIPRK